MNTLIDAIKNNTYESNILEYEEDENVKIEEFFEAFKTNNSITSLVIQYITKEGMKFLSEALKENYSITSLNFQFNKYIQAEKIKYLSEALKTNSSITSLNLYDTDIKEEGIRYLSEALKTNTTLTKLY